MRSTNQWTTHTPGPQGRRIAECMYMRDNKRCNQLPEGPAIEQIVISELASCQLHRGCPYFDYIARHFSEALSNRFFSLVNSRPFPNVSEIICMSSSLSVDASTDASAAWVPRL